MMMMMMMMMYWSHAESSLDLTTIFPPLSPCIKYHVSSFLFVAHGLANASYATVQNLNSHSGGHVRLRKTQKSSGMF